jgi:hypothetical protein
MPGAALKLHLLEWVFSSGGPYLPWQMWELIRAGAHPLPSFWQTAGHMFLRFTNSLDRHDSTRRVCIQQTNLSGGAAMSF